MRPGLVAFVTLALAGCATDEPSSLAEPLAKGPREEVFVARSKPEPAALDLRRPPRMALFHGRYAVVNDCLVFLSATATPALVRFAFDTPIAVHDDRVTIDGTDYPFDTVQTIGGGFDGENNYGWLVETPPERCRYSVIGP